MPISVNDIREKEFAIVKKDGYDSNAVDDFLDEIADQLQILLKENIALANERDELKVALENANTAEPVVKRDDSSYFSTLEAEIRKAISSAQESKEAIIADAKAEAEGKIAAAEARVNELTAVEEDIKTRINGYKEAFKNLVAAQQDIISSSDL